MIEVVPFLKNYYGDLKYHLDSELEQLNHHTCDTPYFSNVREARDYLGNLRKVISTLSDSKSPQTVKEAADQRYSGKTWDTSLPEGWVQSCRERGLNPVGHFVWLYEDVWGLPAPITDEGDRICRVLASTP
ncbi:MAG: hypothetical protein RLZZ602_1323 [Pseudomonadota bacterium]|jgi:hypothetical protein